MKKDIPQKLESLYKKFDERYKNSTSELRPILGGGQFHNPKFLFLFINPTYLNISSSKNYKGKRRYPFIGVRYFWRLLSQARFIDKTIVNDIYKHGWQIEDEIRIEKNLSKHGVYITNLVKATQKGPENPSKSVIQNDFALLEKEINIVNPKYIVAFGRLVFQTLTGKEIKLQRCLNDIKIRKYKPYKSKKILGKEYNVLPCYFPIGRGNPKKALRILSYINQMY
jgi:hypothetical protein